MTRDQVLITGATGKVGRCLAFGFAQNGWSVIITSRNQHRADALVHELTAGWGGNHHGIVFEFASNQSTESFLYDMDRKGLYPKCLVNNVRNIKNLELEPGGRPSSTRWLEEFYLAVVVSYDLTMDLAKRKASKLESVINIASMYGIVAPNQRLYLNPEAESPIHYGVSKAALIHLTKELAVRLAPYNIRVNSISYGGVEGRVSEEFLDRYAALCPQGRMLTEADIAGPALFFASDGASGVTGHNMVVDGGWSIW